MTMAERIEAFTDPIRKHLFEYIYSDDPIEDAMHIEEIFKSLNAIDIQMERYELKIAGQEKVSTETPESIATEAWEMLLNK